MENVNTNIDTTTHFNKTSSIACLAKFVDQHVTIMLDDTSRADKIEGTLIAADPYGIVLSEGNDKRQNSSGVFFYPREILRYVLLTENVDAFRKVA